MARIEVEHGDLWDWHTRGFRVVITTNIGWHPLTYRNNMGAGMALQAEQRWRDLPHWYGRQCAAKGDELGVIEHELRRLVFLPVKPLLDPKNPERSWNQRASLGLIGRGLDQMAWLVRSGPPVAMSFAGAGNGGLDEASVLELLQQRLPARVTVVRYRPRVERGTLADLA